MKKNLILLALIFIFILPTMAQVEFISGGWNEALDEAKKSNKYIFVDAFTDWCYWCKEMDKRTFPDKQVGDLMNAKFVPVKIDMEKEFGVNLAMKYRVASFPTFLVFNPQGHLVYRIQGFSEAEMFLASLNKSLEPQFKDGFKGVSEKITLTYPDFYVSSFKGNTTGKVIKADSVQVVKYLDAQDDLFSEVNWSVLTRFKKYNAKFHQHILDNKVKLSELYGDQEVSGVVEAIVSLRFSESIKRADEAEFNKSLALIDKYMDDNTGKIKYLYRIKFYSETEQWIKMDKMIQEGINTFGYEEFDINGLAWTIYEKCNEPSVVKDAISWMKVLVEKKPSYPVFDTYAALFLKDKQYAMAEKYAGIAIEAGKKDNLDVKDTETLLEKIKKEGGTIK